MRAQVAQTGSAWFGAACLTDAIHGVVCSHPSMNPDDKKPYWCPKTTVFISDASDLIIKVALSGLLTGDIQITTEDKKLRIKGVRLDLEVSNSQKLLVNEIQTGQFESVMEVPDGFDVSAAKSAYLNGVLRIFVPRKSGPSVRTTI